LGRLAPEAALARIGGDEFACVLTPLKNVRRAEEIAQKLLEAVRQPLVVKNEPCVLTASIGIARSPEQGTEVETVLRAAERAMNTAKAGGKGTWSVSAGAASGNAVRTPGKTGG